MRRHVQPSCTHTQQQSTHEQIHACTFTLKHERTQAHAHQWKNSAARPSSSLRTDPLLPRIHALPSLSFHTGKNKQTHKCTNPCFKQATDDTQLHYHHIHIKDTKIKSKHTQDHERYSTWLFTTPRAKYTPHEMHELPSTKQQEKQEKSITLFYPTTTQGTVHKQMTAVSAKKYINSHSKVYVRVSVSMCMRKGGERKRTHINTYTHTHKGTPSFTIKTLTRVQTTSKKNSER